MTDTTSTLGTTTGFPQATLKKTSVPLPTGKGNAIIYELEIHNRPDNRLTPDLILKSLMPALDSVESDWRADSAAGGGAAALITYGPRDKDRFYSNGLDLPLALRTPMFFPRILNPLLARLLTFPIPTIAALTGHAFAGGCTLALAHDFRVMKQGEGKGQIWLSMNEIHFGANIPTGMMGVLKAKLKSDATIRKVVLEGERVGASTALALGLVDELAKTPDEVISKSQKIAVTFSDRAKAQAWGLIKASLYREAIADLATDKGNDGSGSIPPKL